MKHRFAVEITKRLPGFTLDVAWTAGDGVAVLFGPSGAGKTLTLQCLAGLIHPDAGRIVVDDRVLFDAAAGVNLPPQQRRVGYVFQGYALFPHLTVAESVGFGLRDRPREPWPDPAATVALEIGCGLGLAGLAALAAGLGRVDFTDYDRTPLRFIARSAAENGFAPDRFTTTRLDWREPPEARYRLILGADVLYERRLVPLVAHLLDRMLAPGGLALLGGPYRVATEDLEPALGRLGMAVTPRPWEAVDETGRAVRGTIHRVQRPALT